MLARIVDRYGRDRYVRSLRPVAIAKKRLNLDAPLYILLQILSVTLFKKRIYHALIGTDFSSQSCTWCNHLSLFVF